LILGVANYREETNVGRRASLLIILLITLAGCAGNRNAVSSPAEYVEIDNPAFTMSPGAPATIWVPRSYVESGVPRGGELLEKGYEKIRGNAGSGEQPQAPQQAAAVPPAPAQQKSAPAAVVKSRILVVEVGKNGLLPTFNEALKKSSAGIVVDPAQASIIARYASVETQTERSSLAVKLQEDFGVNLVLYLSAPEGVTPGKPLSVEMYEAHGGSLVRRFDAAVPANAASETAAIAAVMQKLALDVRETAALVPWYGKVVSVDASRVYINAGKESGIAVGRVLNVYRAGKVVGKLGFAPGRKVGMLEVTGFVGTDGAFGIVTQGEKAEVSDLVGFE
jgi:hypothetical protein